MGSAGQGLRTVFTIAAYYIHSLAGSCHASVVGFEEHCTGFSCPCLDYLTNKKFLGTLPTK